MTSLIIPLNSYIENATIFPEMLNAIHAIKAEGIKTAILTNNWLLEPGKSALCVNRSLFDVVRFSLIYLICY